MKTLLTAVLFSTFVATALCLWLHPEWLFLLILGAGLFGPVISGLAAIFSSKAPPPPPASHPQPARQPGTLPALLIGLALGWWLGGSFDDGGDC
ncbi:MAG: hypothetical protein PHQ12_12965 [Chthoniobacteraceae bacterium]|nr:hypothetical protein [Chthoniobacteraceae bacterium]